MKHSISALSLIVASVLVAPPVIAAQSWFEVEVILFERHGEHSKEKFTDLIKHYNTTKAITLQSDAVYGTLKDCPTLSQFERFSLQPVDVEESEPVNTISSLQQPVTSVTPDVSAPVTTCILPDDSLLIEAYKIKRQRLNSIVNPIDTSAGLYEQSLAQRLSNNAPVELNQPIESDIDITYDPNTFVPYPITFTFNAIDYQGVIKPEKITKIPITIKHEGGDDDNNTHDNSITEDAQAPQLKHNPLAPYLLDDDHLQMTKLVQKLRWQKATTPLLHLGWRQPMLARHLAKPLHLFAGSDYSQQFDRLGNDLNSLTLIEPEPVTQHNISVDTPPMDAVVLPLSTNISDILLELAPSAVTPPIWQLEGLLNIYLNHYLFIETDFDLRKTEQVKTERELSEQLIIDEARNSRQEPQDSLSQAEPNISDNEYVTKLTSHPMKQHRRVRSKEIHYFDHPNMGIIIQIRRFKIPQEPVTLP